MKTKIKKGRTIHLIAESHRMPKRLKDFILSEYRLFLREYPHIKKCKYKLDDFKCWRSYRANLFVHKSGVLLRVRYDDEPVMYTGVKHPQGYLALYNRGPLVHRIVATVWKKNKTPELTPIVNHSDGDKYNNCIDNLEWCNNSYNILHARASGLNPYNKPTSGLKLEGQRKGTSKYFGVFYEKGRCKWVGQVRHDNVLYGRRRFDFEEDAAQHYNNVCDILKIKDKPRNPFPKQPIKKSRLKGRTVLSIGSGIFLFTVSK